MRSPALDRKFPALFAGLLDGLDVHFHPLGPLAVEREYFRDEMAGLAVDAEGRVTSAAELFHHGPLDQHVGPRLRVVECCRALHQ